MSSVHEGGPQSDVTGAIIKRGSLTEKGLPRGGGCEDTWRDPRGAGGRG